MKHVLVTGAAGFIGCNFVRHLLRQERQCKVFSLDALTYAGSEHNLAHLDEAHRHEFIHGNICDDSIVKRVLQEHKIDTVVHFAAESHVDRSILGPGQFVQTNIVGTFNLLEACRTVWVGQPAVRFHHISTDEVFGSLYAQDPAFTESTPYDPSSPYSASKAASDHLVRAYARTYGLPATITNCSNNYGPYQFPEKLIPLIILNAIQGKPLPVYGDGLQVRDWLYVEDHCEAILRVLQLGKTGETYNIGGGNQPTNIEIVKSICSLLDELHPQSPTIPHEKLITYVADRPGHDRRYAMDITKIRRDVGWSPRHTLTDGLRKTVQWYLAHLDWVAGVSTNGNYQQWVDKNYAQRSAKKEGKI